MRIPAAVLADVDHRAAVIGELTPRNAICPCYAGRPRAPWPRRGPGRGRVYIECSQTFDPARQESVLARKAGRGFRPPPDIDLRGSGWSIGHW